MDKLKSVYRRYLCNGLVFSAVLAFVMNLFIETMARHSLLESCRFLGERPSVFLFNTFIIFATYSIGILFRRRVFWYVIMSAPWLILGVVNGVILINRMTPFTVKDMANLNDGLSIVTNYLPPAALIFAIVGILALLAALVMLFLFGPKKKEKVRYKRNVAAVVLVAVSFFGVWQLAIQTKTVATFFGNLAYAYRDYGVPYCFISTWLDTGISKPAGYSKESIENIFTANKLGKGSTYKPQVQDDDENHPNILFLQLESFIDPTLVKGYAYSKDPVSYTHLDVYKRQVFFMAGNKFHLICFCTVIGIKLCLGKGDFVRRESCML